MDDDGNDKFFFVFLFIILYLVCLVWNSLVVKLRGKIKLKEKTKSARTSLRMLF